MTLTRLQFCHLILKVLPHVIHAGRHGQDTAQAAVLHPILAQRSKGAVVLMNSVEGILFVRLALLVAEQILPLIMVKNVVTLEVIILIYCTLIIYFKLRFSDK